MSGNTGNLGTGHLVRVNAGQTTTTQGTPASPLVADASPAVGDWIFDGGIAFLIIVMAAFLSISFWDSKDKGGE